MATVPPAPTLNLPSALPDGRSVSINVNGSADGGSPIIQKRVGYGTSSTAPTDYMNLNSFGNGVVEDLTPGTLYYFWGQYRNAIGWGPRSVRKQIMTKAYPKAPTAPVLTDPHTASISARISQGDMGGNVAIERQLEYSATPVGTTGRTVTLVPIPTSLTLNLRGLPGGRMLYFRARVRTAVGWSPWSAVSSKVISSGVSMTVVVTTTTPPTVPGGPSHSTTRVFQKPAIPWFNVDGVWKVGIPYANVGGLWKETK